MPGRYFRLAAAFLALSLVLCGCSSVLSDKNETKTTLLRLSIQKGIPAEASQGMEVFISRIEELSDGKLKIEKSVSDDPIAALDRGSDIIFASNEEITRANGDFLSVTSPFFFENYTQMTVTLNSQDFAELIKEKTGSLLGASPLAAFYGGTRVLLSDESDILDVWDGWQGIEISVTDGSELLRVALNGLGAKVTERSASTLLDGFLTGQLRTVECEARELYKIESSTVRNAPVYVYDSFHAPTLHWLMIDDETWASLDEFGRAVVTEAAASALAVNDIAVTGEEEGAYEHVEALGIPVYEMDYGEFCEQVDAVFLEEVRYRNLWDWEIHRKVRALNAD